MKTGVSMIPRGVVSRPSRAFEEGSVFSSSNICLPLKHEGGTLNTYFWLPVNRSLRSAGFQPAVSPTFSRPGVGLRERAQVAAPVGYARRLRVENPRYSRLESLRYGVHGPKARLGIRGGFPWTVAQERRIHPAAFGLGHSPAG
jgi:hypothetical protein